MDIDGSPSQFMASNRWPLLLFGLCVLLFWMLPTLDLTVTRWFFVSDTFPWDTHVVIEVIYRVFANIHFFFLLALPLAALREHSRRSHTVDAERKRRLYLFLWFSLIVGPGVITHVGLKDNSFGRPRPRDVTQFHGDHAYAAPFEYSKDCRRNCSFVSGHAAIGFWFMTFAWCTRHRQWLLAGAIIGVVVGGARVIQGAHFLSDVVFAFWVVWFSNALLAPRFGFNANPLQRNVVVPTTH